MDGLTPADALAQAQALQKKFVASRKRWARSIGFPYSHDIDSPDPGVIDDLATEEG